MNEGASTIATDIRAELRTAIEGFDHVLPAQAAIRDFVHHNTLHGFESQDFPVALEQAEKLFGAGSYLPEARFREFYRQGRINQDDLRQALLADADLSAGKKIFNLGEKAFCRLDIMLVAMLHPLDAVTGCQLSWQIDEKDALHRFQSDVSALAQVQILEAGEKTEAQALLSLWQICLQTLGLEHYLYHPEKLVDLSVDEAERMLSEVLDKEDNAIPGQHVMDSLIARQAGEQMKTLFARLGEDLTLAGLLKALTGEDLLEEMRPLLSRYLGSFLDQGLAAWHLPDREQGFYAAWRASAALDLAWIFEELPDWEDSLDALPDDSLDTVIIELKWLGLEEKKWVAYLQRLSLELPGWSGMFLWRHQRPGYDGLDQIPVEMMDYLAVRLVLERLYAQRLCRRKWMIEASFDILRWYFNHHRAEFLVRYISCNERLPEYLVTQSQTLLQRSEWHSSDEERWLHLAHMIWTWRQSPAADRSVGYSVYRSAWPLFRLSQHLGLCAAEVAQLDRNAIDGIFKSLQILDAQQRSFLWLQAYEHHYREPLFNALRVNRGRGRWRQRDSSSGRSPEAQLIFCMDDREEGFRRHLEEKNPALETLGAAGFFAVPINWKGLDDENISLLCPVVLIPSHEIHERPQANCEAQASRHNRRYRGRRWLGDLLFQETRRNLFTSSLLIALAAPAALGIWMAKIIAPALSGHLFSCLRESFDLLVPTRMTLTAEPTVTAGTPEQPQQGFTDEEQVARVAGFLRTIGLSHNFAPLVVVVGHGSMSQNNPHLAAYDCGACSGRHGGPNARAFAAMANRPEVREALLAQGLVIPESTWFLGAEHDTCNERIHWYDLDALPEIQQANLEKLQHELDVAGKASAHERCRRLASAPKKPSLKQALKHIMGRATDFSQARPELGHATNAAAFIGRRSMSQGAFFDRRVFLISYNPQQDQEGTILEAILLAVGPVGAGINLEYYFSTVDNEGHGSGSKVTHNITGLFGVMDGASSDLRTGLPRQMTEIHEAMRLQIVVEASVEVLSAIYARQLPLQELIGNGWLLLSAMDPLSGEISVFDPDKGFSLWQPAAEEALPMVKHSVDWYQGHHQPLSPALIEQEAVT
ncbi:Hypothetical transmembrane protein coupled to NADH-ubiquinone oxidoreductase chain 5 homolog [hydrothermal vent metagenome]|uniref:Hypothetical transmembrane protein coupled to NADH-ubiquinone oxidoreductase chain 5 homolog n=1 Tax=hydrothermal vent metagenome TaxID=652676 RepID=A0A3B1B9S2_9ZZZZ